MGIEKIVQKSVLLSKTLGVKRGKNVGWEPLQAFPTLPAAKNTAMI